MDCRITSAHKFRTRLGYKQYDVILTKKQSVLTKIMGSFEGENMQTQCLNLQNQLVLMTIRSKQKFMNMNTATEILTTKLKATRTRTWLQIYQN